MTGLVNNVGTVGRTQACVLHVDQAALLLGENWLLTGAPWLSFPWNLLLPQQTVFVLMEMRVLERQEALKPF